MSEATTPTTPGDTPRVVGVLASRTVHCDGCGRTFANIDGCDICRTDRYLRAVVA